MYWETGSKEYTLPESEYKKVSNANGLLPQPPPSIVPMPSKLYSASEKGELSIWNINFKQQTVSIYSDDLNQSCPEIWLVKNFSVRFLSHRAIFIPQ